MDRLIKIFVLSILINCCPKLWSQTPISVKEGAELIKNNPEKVYVHLNQNTFLTGDVLFYKMYCLNTNDFSQSKISKIAYIELIDINKKIIFKQKIFLKKSVGFGDYFIPKNIKTGNYTLIGYTNWMLNMPSTELFQQNITIINQHNKIEKNEFSIQDINEKNIASNDNYEQNKEIYNELQIELNKETFENRDLVSIKMKNLKDLSKNGSYSLSVRKINDLILNQKITSIDFKNKTVSSAIVFQKDQIILPELRGENISGYINSKNQSKINNIIIALSIPCEGFFTKTVSTNDRGRFIFYIDKPYYQSNIIIQVFDENRQNYEIKIDKPEALSYETITVKNSFRINPELKSKIENQSIANQIENAYFLQKKDSIYKPINQKLFYDPIAKDYLLDNYTRFETTKETITEVLKEMFYTENKDVYKIGLRDINSNSEIAQPPLVMIDGLIIQDLKELFEYKMSNIYKVSIIPGGYYYGPNLFNGLINFITKNKDFESKLTGDFLIKLDILRPLINKTYFKIDYTDKQKTDRIPDYRYQLAWQPELDLGNNFTFYTSDVSGLFEISIEGFSDIGTPLSIKKVFEVK